MSSASKNSDDSFVCFPGCIPEPGFQPESNVAYLNDAAAKLTGSSDFDLAKWSQQMCRRVAAHGMETVLEQHVLDLMVLSYVKPGFLENQVQSWCAAATASSEPLAESGVEEEKEAEAVVQPRAIYHRGLGNHTKPGEDGKRVVIDGVLDESGKPVEIYEGQKFANWGDTVKNAPTYTCYPLSSTGVQAVVRHFVGKNARIRCAGSRHSWSDVFNTPRDNARTEVLICTMQMDAALPGEFGQLDENVREDTDLNEIKLIKTTDAAGRESARVRLGGAVTSEFFRRWALSDKRGEGEWKWMLRALPILVAITSPGWTQVICHGSGIKHQTVSDLVTRMEIINCRGERQIIEDRELLRAASGSFGLLGFVVSQDFVVDPLQLARFTPKKRPVLLSVPPLRREDVPKTSPFNYDAHTEEEYAAAVKEFETDAGRFYNEFFWFPLQKECWINCWDTAAPDGSRPQYPDAAQVKADNIQAAAAATLESRSFYKYIPPKLQTTLTASSAMLVLPNEGDYPKGLDYIPSNVPDSLHFRRGIHRMPVRDTEVSIEVPSLPRARLDEPLRPDLRVVRQAWWAAIAATYDAAETGATAEARYPMRTTLEMRLVGGSDVWLSSQFGNAFTCTIEVLTSSVVSDDVWRDYVNDVVARWKSLDEVKRRGLRVKFHWAKEWPTLVDGVPTKDYVRDVYKAEVPRFKDGLEKIGAASNVPYTLQDALHTFGNDTLIDTLGL